MPHEFHIEEEIALDATPDQVWEAIATGPGVDSWFMGRNEIEPREGGVTRMTMGEHAEEGMVTAWQPRQHFAFKSKENVDGTFMAFEYLIEGRGGGSTVLRFVHSGFLGDDWEEQYDALRKGDVMYLHKLALYVKYFAGRASEFNMLAHGPQVPEERAWAAYREALGLSSQPAVGDAVRIAVPDLAPVEGVVEFVSLPTYAGVRTADGMYTFMHGYADTVVVEHHNFAEDVDGPRIEKGWQSWIAARFA